MTLEINPVLAKLLSEANAKMDAIREEVQEAQKALEAAKDKDIQFSHAASDAERNFTVDLIQQWLLVQLAGKTVREQQDFADKLAKMLIEGRGFVARDIQNEVFAKNEELFKKIHPKSSCENHHAYTYDLFRKYLGDAIDCVFVAVSPVWRDNTQGRRYNFDRESELRRLAYDNPPRLLVRGVWGILRENKRIKNNPSTWKDCSKTAYSFRNQKTIEADIAKAVEIMAARQQAHHAYPWAA